MDVDFSLPFDIFENPIPDFELEAEKERSKNHGQNNSIAGDLKKEPKQEKIILIGSPREFLVGSMKSALSEYGYEVDIFNPEMMPVNKMEANACLYILMTRSLTSRTTLLAFLKNKIYDRNFHLCIMCDKLEESSITRILPKEFLFMMFFRPFKTKEICAQIRNKLQRYQKNAKGAHVRE